MIDIGINYLTELNNNKNKYDDIYEFLINKNYINTIKFPGKYCDYENLDMFIAFAKKKNVKIDLHGLPGMFPCMSSKKLLEGINWELLKEKLENYTGITRISTHLGIENKDRLPNYTNHELEKIWTENFNTLKSRMKDILEIQIDVGLENIPGGFDFDVKTLSPDEINKNWGKADFGVFDISHAKLAAKELNISFDEYIQKLEYKNKVKIIHVSGVIDETEKYSHKPDKHVVIHKDEIKDIIRVINTFKNVDLVVSEYAFNTKYSTEKEIIIEAMTLSAIVKTMDCDYSEKVLNILKNQLKDDISNLSEIIKNINI